MEGWSLRLIFWRFLFFFAGFFVSFRLPNSRRDLCCNPLFWRIYRFVAFWTVISACALSFFLYSCVMWCLLQGYFSLLQVGSCVIGKFLYCEKFILPLKTVIFKPSFSCCRILFIELCKGVLSLLFYYAVYMSYLKEYHFSGVSPLGFRFYFLLSFFPFPLKSFSFRNISDSLDRKPA